MNNSENYNPSASAIFMYKRNSRGYNESRLSKNSQTGHNVLERRANMQTADGKRPPRAPRSVASRFSNDQRQHQSGNFKVKGNVIATEAELKVQQEKIKNLLLSTTGNKRSHLSSQELFPNPVEQHRKQTAANEGKTTLLDGHMTDLPQFLAEKVSGRVNS